MKPTRAVLALTVLASVPVLAQTRVPTPDILRDTARRTLVVEKATTVTANVPNGSRGHVIVPALGERLGNGALSSFQLQYNGSDHKLRAVAIEQVSAQAGFMLADKQPEDDPFSGSATWLKSGYFTELTEVKANAAGDFLLDIPAGPAGHVPLLAGFAFIRPQGTDANIRTIAVQLMDGQNKVRVALLDDQGPDFRNFTHLATGAILGGPIGGAVSSGLALQEFGVFDGRRLRTYQVRLQIVWAPRAAVIGTGSVSGMSRRADSGRLPAVTDKVALRGFRFTFGNSDHHLKAIGVRLQAGSRNDPVLFQDNETDDPVAWSVDYAKMR